MLSTVIVDVAVSIYICDLGIRRARESQCTHQEHKKGGSRLHDLNCIVIMLFFW